MEAVPARRSKTLIVTTGKKNILAGRLPSDATLLLWDAVTRERKNFSLSEPSGPNPTIALFYRNIWESEAGQVLRPENLEKSRNRILLCAPGDFGSYMTEAKRSARRTHGITNPEPTLSHFVGSFWMRFFGTDKPLSGEPQLPALVVATGWMLSDLNDIRSREFVSWRQKEICRFYGVPIQFLAPIERTT